MSGKINLKHLFNVECLQQFSSNGQMWPTKKSVKPKPVFNN